MRGGGVLRRAGTGMKRPFLWVGSSRALHHQRRRPRPQAQRLAERKEKGSTFRPLACFPLGVLTCRSRGPRWEFTGQRVPPGSRKPEETTSARDAHLSRRPLGPAGSWVGAQCPRLTARDLFPRRRRRRRRERCPRWIRISELPPLPGMRALCPSREEVRRPVPGRVVSARDAGGGGAVLAQPPPPPDESP